MQLLYTKRRKKMHLISFIFSKLINFLMIHSEQFQPINFPYIESPLKNIYICKILIHYLKDVKSHNDIILWKAESACFSYCMQERSMNTL